MNEIPSQRNEVNIVKEKRLIYSIAIVTILTAGMCCQGTRKSSRLASNFSEEKVRRLFTFVRDSELCPFSSILPVTP